MNSYILIQELKRLFRENKKSIYLMTGFLSLAIVGIIMFLTLSGNTNSDVITPQEESNDSALFRIYVEHEDGTVFANSMIIEEYMLLPETLAEAEKTTGVEITDILDDQLESKFVKTQYDRGVMGISRHGSTNIFTFFVNVGDANDNLKIADFYFDYLFSDEIKMLADKNINIVSEPALYDEKSYGTSELSAKEPLELQSSELSFVEIIILVVAALVIGLMLSLLYVIFRNLLSKKINYAFTYGISDMDSIILLDHKDEYLLERTLRNTSYSPVIIFSETTIPSNLLHKDIPIIISDTIEKVDLTVKIVNPIIIIKTGETNKNWYKNLMKDLSMLETSKIIIQIN